MIRLLAASVVVFMAAPFALSQGALRVLGCPAPVPVEATLGGYALAACPAEVACGLGAEDAGCRDGCVQTLVQEEERAYRAALAQAPDAAAARAVRLEGAAWWNAFSAAGDAVEAAGGPAPREACAATMLAMRAGELRARVTDSGGRAPERR